MVLSLLDLPMAIREIYKKYHPFQEIQSGLDDPLPSHIGENAINWKERQAQLPPAVPTLRLFCGFFAFIGFLMVMASSYDPQILISAPFVLLAGYFAMFARRIGVILMAGVSLYPTVGSITAFIIDLQHGNAPRMDAIIACSIISMVLSIAPIQGILSWNKLKWF